MSQAQSTGGSGSVRRAREQAEAGLPDNGRGRRPRTPQRMQGKDGQITMPISRPSPLPQSQWPLPESRTPPSTSPDTETYKPPAGSLPPQRPPRPSVVPSILDGSKIQEHTPVFQYMTTDDRSSEISSADTFADGHDRDRPQTVSSVGSIPDFPLPSQGQLQQPSAPGPPRRSVNLGPPPSSRRGASSFYSTASFVSPIPEESPRRSRTSAGSSIGLAPVYGEVSPIQSPEGAYFDDNIPEEGAYGDGIEEKGLVRSASIGKRGKPSLVTTKGAEKADSVSRPGAKPMQSSAFKDGTAFIDGSSSSSGGGSMSDGKGGMAFSANSVLSAYEAASASDPAVPKHSRLSAIRRPPRLDMDAVRDAEARGSMTSLPDLIKRATRLASMMDKGRRPASRVDDLLFTSEDVYARRERDFGHSEKYQSGLSDMLAAFPPPAISQKSARGAPTWPMEYGSASVGDPMDSEARRALDEKAQNQKRRCCGLPRWLVLVIIFVILCMIAAAVAVPLKLVVFKDNPNTPAAALETCQAQMVCQNGGTNVIANGECACICSNGFTGPTCTIASSQGCITTTIMTGGNSSGEVTVGQAIPRLLEQAQNNFSIPLSASEVLAKFSSSNLTCSTQNALVTFGGQAPLLDNALQQAGIESDYSNPNIPVITTVLPDLGLTLTLTASQVYITTMTHPVSLPGSHSTILTTVVSMSNGMPYPTVPAIPSLPPTATGAAPTPAPTAPFEVDDTVYDFARVAVLYILQEMSLNQVAIAQSSLQKFFAKARPDASSVTVDDARRVGLGSGITIDLVGLFINLGKGNIGGGPAVGQRAA